MTEIRNTIPEQLKPFPSYPELQEQLYEPGVLVQFAFSSHLLMFVPHSLISAKRDNCFDNCSKPADFAPGLGSSARLTQYMVGCTSIKAVFMGYLIVKT